MTGTKGVCLPLRKLSMRRSRFADLLINEIDLLRTHTATAEHIMVAYLYS